MGKLVLQHCLIQYFSYSTVTWYFLLNFDSSVSQVHPDLLQLKSLLAGITLTGTSKDQSGASIKATPIATNTMDDIPGVGSREETYSPIPGSLPSDTTWEPEEIVPYAERLSKDSDPEGKATKKSKPCFTGERSE